MIEKDIRAILQRLICKAENLGAAASEAVWTSQNYSETVVGNGELEQARSGSVSYFGVRVLDATGRQGVACMNDYDESSAEMLCRNALRSASAASSDSDVIFASVSPRRGKDLGIYDPSLMEWSEGDKQALCLEMSHRAENASPLISSVRSVALDARTGESFSLNSNGAESSCITSSGSISLTLFAEENGDIEIGGADAEARSKEKLLAQDPVTEAVRNTVRMLHGRSLPSGVYTLVLEPEVTASFLSVLADLFSASNVCKGMSMLGDRMGGTVASSVLTLIDDGRLYGEAGTSYCDSEFVPTSRTVLVERGKLCGWLCNLQYGHRLGLPSTGNGYRGVSSLPDVDVSNFFVLPGTRSAEEIRQANDGCFCVTELMGLHTVDTATGDFSLAARGLYLKGGLFRPVSSVTIAGNLTEFLNKITEVGSDLRFYDRFGGCTMVVEDIALAGA